jgi:glycerol uptake facilitator-like aquaporin
LNFFVVGNLARKVESVCVFYYYFSGCIKLYTVQKCLESINKKNSNKKGRNLFFCLGGGGKKREREKLFAGFIISLFCTLFLLFVVHRVVEDEAVKVSTLPVERLRPVTL